MYSYFLLTSGNGTNSAYVNSTNSFESLGQSIAFVNNLNKSNRSTVFISAPYYSTESNLFSGKVYVLQGASTPLSQSQTLQDLIVKYGGFSIYGYNSSFALFGSKVVNIGDVNNGGLNDIAITSSNARNSLDGTGVISVFYSEYFTGQDVYASDLNGVNGFNILSTQNGVSFGYSLNGIGDNNKDGIQDWSYGSPCYGGEIAAPACNGTATIMYGIEGSKINLPPVIPDIDYAKYGYRVLPTIIIEADNNCTSGPYVLTKIKSDNLLGFAVTGIDDFDDDGNEDLIITAPGTQFSAMYEPSTTNAQDSCDSFFNRGAAYIIYGRNYSFFGDLLTTSINQQNGASIYYPCQSGDISCPFISGPGNSGNLGYSVLGRLNFNNTVSFIVTDYYTNDNANYPHPWPYNSNGAGLVVDNSCLTYSANWPENFVNLTAWYNNSNGLLIYDVTSARSTGNFHGKNENSLLLDGSWFFRSYFVNATSLVGMRSVNLDSSNVSTSLGIEIDNSNNILFGETIAGSFSIGDYDGDGVDDAIFTSTQSDASLAGYFYIVFSDNV